MTPNEIEYQLRLKREGELLAAMVKSIKKVLRNMKAEAPEAYAEIVRYVTADTVN